MRRILLLSSLAAIEAACTRDGAKPAATHATPPVEVVAVTLDAGGGMPASDETPAARARAALAPYVVIHPKPARRTLYTWTIREQLDELAATRVLLSRSESPQHGASFYDQRAALLAAKGDGLAKLLRSQAFVKARFAWSAPWATALGLPGEAWGDELLTVVLKPEAWIVVFRTSKSALEVVDGDDRPVPIATALASPQRIAAVYFVHDDPVSLGSRGTTFGPLNRRAYREYVLVNESMVESWSFRTPTEAAAIDASARAVEALADYTATLREPPAIGDENAVIAAWTHAPGTDVLATFQASLAFPDAGYGPSPAALRELARKLRDVTLGGPSLRHSPSVVFPSAATSVAAPPPGGRR